jgi:hypothetical protein
MDLVPIAPQWAVRMPTVTRYLPQRFVEAFFERGELLLSSFERFREHPEIACRDRSEGSPAVSASDPDASTPTIEAELKGGAYVLCGSTLDDASMQGCLGHSSAIHIRDPVKFAAAVARHVPEVVGGFFGACNCTTEPIAGIPLERLAVQQAYVAMTGGAPEEFWGNLQRAMAPLAPHEYDGLFRKHTKYADQHEFRFVWFSRMPQRPSLPIVCPEAISFCEPRPR